MEKVRAISISEKGIGLIKSFEGLVLHPYLDAVSVPTIGYGTTHYENGASVKMTDAPLTKRRAEQLLNFEVQAKGYVIKQSLQKDNIVLTQNQIDALNSFAYNVGIAGLLGSTLYKKMKRNPNDPSIKDEFEKWVYGTVGKKKVKLEGLVKRRSEEAALYFS